jgi:peroxin-5
VSDSWYVLRRLIVFNQQFLINLKSLATAFTNEGYERGSHAMLLRWLSARFPEHALPPDEMASTLRLSHWASRERVTEAFISVARAQHAAGVLDPDVQSGLGVLSYISGDFSRAQDCFSAALAARPRDYLLWNRLGSSLSNDNKPEDALGAYREALQLRPTYTRAIYNVGVACKFPLFSLSQGEHFMRFHIRFEH